MAEKFGSSAECLSQKRSWVDCQSPGDKSTASGDCHSLEPPLLFPKRSRSEQEFVKKDELQRSASDCVGPGCDTNSSRCLEATSYRGDDSQMANNDHQNDVSFTIGTGESDGGSFANNKNDVTEEQNSNQNIQEDAEGDDGSLSSDLIIDIDEEGSGWRPMAGPLSWVQHQMSMGVDPREILKHILPHHTPLPDDLDQLMLWKLIINIISEPPPRKKLKHINTLDQVVNLIKECKNILVLTGAGVSVSCGIPDFRSQNGIYARLSVEYPDLPDPQAMFDIRYFHQNQKPFFKFAKEIYPGQFEPSRSHKFIKLIEDHNKLLRNYTQNIDTLEQVAGIKNVIQCHGSFATATCMVCKYKTDADAVRDDIMNQVIPRCPKCPSEDPLAILKPDIVFFGESLPSEFHNQMEQDKDVCDLLIVIGSSLKVRPVALIPNSLPDNVPQVLINREPLKHLNFDVELLGDCDIIVQELCKRLGSSWQSICATTEPAMEINYNDMPTPSVQSPLHHPTPPNSEESTRMSFQMSSDDNNSRMSVSQDTESVSQAQLTAEQGDLNVGFNLYSAKEDSRMSFDDGDAKHGSGQACSSEISETTSSSQPQNHQGQCTVNESKQISFENQTESLVSSAEADDASNQESTSTAQASDSTTNLAQACSQRQLEELRSCWQPKLVNLAAKLKDDTFLFVPPNRYVFKGAEVYDNFDSDTDDDTSSGSSGSLDTLEQDIDVSLLKSDCPVDEELDLDGPSFEEEPSISSNTKHASSS